MVGKLKESAVLWIVLGVLLGFTATWLFHDQPAQATATDRNEEFAIATGLLQRDLEAVYLLDFRTGMLMATVMNTQTGQFQPFSSRRLANDFRIDPRSKPRFIMVTGRMQAATSRVPINHLLYVAEVNSGVMCAYFMPYLGATTAGSLAPGIELVGRIAFRGGIVGRPRR